MEKKLLGEVSSKEHSLMNVSFQEKFNGGEKMKKWMIVVGVLVVIAILLFIFMRPPAEVRNSAGEVMDRNLPAGSSCRPSMGDCGSGLTCGEGNVCVKPS